jgi:hypothetical protein
MTALRGAMPARRIVSPQTNGSAAISWKNLSRDDLGVVDSGLTIWLVRNAPFTH